MYAEDTMNDSRREEAISYIREDLDIHAQWVRYLTENPDAATETVCQGDAVGDVAHHQEWMRRLDLVLQVLTTAYNRGERN